MENATLSVAELNIQKYENNLINFSAITMTIFSTLALLVNLYLLNCARYLRRPVGVNLRLCVFLLGCDALCSLCYIFTYLINIFFSHFSNCASLLLEVVKMSTFTASVVTLSALAFNHYVGIVYPLHRNAITPRTVKWTVIMAFVIPLSVYLAIFTIFPGGLRAPVAFAFFDADGCQGNAIYRNNFFRASLVGPFIFFIAMLSFLYLHILIHMRNVSRDPLLSNNNNNNKRTNRKLLITILLLAGSACAGWLPTTLNFILPLLFTIPRRARLYMGILAQFLHVVKLLADAFIYARRLIEIKYAMFVFNRKCRVATLKRLHMYRENEKQDVIVPKEFVKYLSETKENRSVRSKRVKSEFQNSDKARFGAERPKKCSPLVSNNNSHTSPNGSSHLTAHHQPLKTCQSVPSVVVQSPEASKTKKNSNSVIVKTVRLSTATSFNLT
uniref:G_PROTEIN_RECEP_F1_2 domain-containing protein n=1 Tax=Caenorhabditis japonica TaxID=281687 RepID=A0A8R1I6K1_CAEJA